MVGSVAGLSMPSTLTPLPLASGFQSVASAWGMDVALSDVSDASGAPLAGPVLKLPMDMPAQMLIQILADLGNKLAGLQTATRLETIKGNEQRTVELREDLIKEFTRVIDEAAEALRLSKDNAVLNWVMLALSVVVAAVMTVCSLGAASVLLAGATVALTAQVAAAATVAVAVLGMVMAVTELISAVAQHCGATMTDINGKQMAFDIGIQGFIRACVAQAIQSGDVVLQDAEGRYLNAQGEVDTTIQPKAGATIRTKEQLEQDVAYATMGFTLALAFSMVAGGVGGSVGVYKAIGKIITEGAKLAGPASHVFRLSQTMANMATALDTFSTFAQGAVQTGGSAIDVVYAIHVRDQTLAQTEKSFIEAELEVLMQNLAIERDAVNRALQQFDEAAQMLAAMLQQLQQAMTTVARNTAVTTTA